jgi:transcriptional regulator with XRE-family HTH domain
MTDKTRRMMEAREQGLTYQQIADLFGVSKQRVGQVLGRYEPAKFQYVSEKGCIYPNWRKWMNENKVGRNELLRRMGLQAAAESSHNLASYMTGRTNPRKPYIDKLLKVTGLTYEELFYEEVTE